MIARNPNISKLKSNYLFPEIQIRKTAFAEKNPGKKIISLGIGDTTKPIPETISQALSQKALQLSSPETYTGYGPEQGSLPLRNKIASEAYHGIISSDEIFISDGAKCDIGRLQVLFGQNISIAVQDPTYPVYLEGSIIQGVKEIIFLPCTPENNFFPNLSDIPRTDLIYFCSPNNPTGAVATKEQLKELVQFAKKNKSIIIFDAAYSFYIHHSDLPKTIYEIEGAKEVAIEVHSFSKVAGFTGVRLGWTVVPKELLYSDGSSVKADWKRLISTIFNGASNIAQHGGEAVFESKGQEEFKKNIHYYLENARLIRAAFKEKGYEVYGGEYAPFIWVKFKGKDSWDVFQDLLEKIQIVATPGSGFGSMGEGFMRFSAFGSREDTLEAIKRLSTIL